MSLQVLLSTKPGPAIRETRPAPRDTGLRLDGGAQEPICVVAMTMSPGHVCLDALPGLGVIVAPQRGVLCLRRGAPPHKVALRL